MKRLIATLAGSALLAFPLAVSAQSMDGPPPKPPASDETIHGTVDSLADHYTLLLKDDRGFVDTVTLRDETVVNPNNLNLTAGLQVTIIGHASGKVFVADEVDAPNAPQSAQGGPQQGPPEDGYGGAADAPPPYQAPPDVAPNGPAYESSTIDPGYDAPPDLVYGSPYVGPAYGIAIGGYYGGYCAYCGGGYYYGGYYGRPYYGGGYYPGGYYHGGYPANPSSGGYGSPPHTTLPIRRAPGYGYPINNSRAPYYAPGSTYRAAPQSSTYRASSSHAQSSSHASSSSSHR